MKIVLVLLVIFLSLSNEGYSCSCYFLNLQEEIEFADLIFQGIPKGKEQVGGKFRYKFVVEQIWKGENADTIRIETNMYGQSCGMPFELNKSYIVFSKDFQTSHCRRNSLVNETFDNLKLDYLLLEEYYSDSFINTNKQLNTNESDYLKRQFPDVSKKYDFTNKSILFTSNLKTITKREWFQRYLSYDNPAIQLVELTEKEKIETGYDTILVTYSKRYISEKHKKNILRQVKGL